MLLNLPSRIIVNLLFNGIEKSLKSTVGFKSIALSPIIDNALDGNTFRHELLLKTNRKGISVFISYDNFSEEEIEACKNLFMEKLDYTETSVKLVFKREISASFNEPSDYASFPKFEILISIKREKCNSTIHLLLPLSLFIFLVPSVHEDTSASEIERLITGYFRNPALLVPDARTMIETLGTVELGLLFNRLQACGMLTNYQLMLLVIAFPELSLKIKKCLSQNSIDDLIALKKNIARYHVEARDIQGGLYSIEEAIFMLVKSGFTFKFSRYLSEIESILKSILGMDLLLRKDFISWIDEMSAAGLLYDTVSRCKEEIIAQAIAPDRKTLIPILAKYVSQNKIISITDLIYDEFNYESVLESRISIVSTYRRLKFQRYQNTHDSFEYLIARFKNDRDYLFLLVSVGWFTLSTALKGVSPKNTRRVMSCLPEGARFLMEDILKGIVNPNIIHDEIQVNRAKLNCVNAILSLYEDGMVAFDE